MADMPQHQPARRLLVVMPSWVGDTVMATPTLRALRKLYPQAHIAALIRRELRPLLEACPWVDRVLSFRRGSRPSGSKRQDGPFRLAARLGRANFDTAVLLPNSFRWALLARMARIPRRVGYDRDGRGFLLTDRLMARRETGRFIPVPTLDYYLGIARYLGATDADPAMQLFTRPEDDQRAAHLLTEAGALTPGRPLVLLNPGANYGDAKMWPAERFAAVAQRCVEQHHAVVAITGAPRERRILDEVIRAASAPIIDLPRLGMDLTLLKSVVKHTRLMITNDTGPRHIAAALGVPVVTVFGPTDPVWSEVHFELERQVRVDVFCGPCQKKRCPLDHRCMTLVTPDMVAGRAGELLQLTVGPSEPPAETARA